jgi:glyoxylase-like metal-dependent hydrolase (beta-lactamase superfamily II)
LSALQVVIIPVTPFQQNCALIWDSESLQGAVFDPGGDVPNILATIAKHSVNVEKIYLTHGHLDHAGGAAELAKALGVPVIGPDRRDDFLLADITGQAKRYGLTGLASVKPDAWLQEGDSIAIGGHEFSILHCPGHTPGHIVFVNRTLNLGIFGDVLFQNSVGRTDFPYGDHPALISSIIEKLMILPDNFTFTCGHGPASTIGAERRNNPFIQ